MDVLSDFFRYYPSGNSDNGVRNFSLEHFGWLGIAIVTLLLTVLAYRNFDMQTRQLVIKLCAVGLLLLYMQRSLWAAALGRFNFSSMLPFHLCSIMVFLEFIAVFFGNKLMKEFVYCAGMPGAALALFTPELNGYPLFSFQYQAFIISHMLLVIIPLFWIFGDDYEPDITYMKKSYMILCFLALCDGVLNKVLKGNYMFVSRAPINTPIVIVEKQFGYFGYLLFLIVTAFLTMRLMYLPWRAKQRNTVITCDNE